MNKPATFTLKIINDTDVLDSFPKARELTEDQKALIAFVARTAVQNTFRRSDQGGHNFLIGLIVFQTQTALCGYPR